MRSALLSTWPAPDADWRLPHSLITQINAAIVAPLPAVLTKTERHDLAQRRLVALGAELGYEARKEVATGHRQIKRDGRFDATWTPSAGGRRIVFEIDSCWRHKSILKLGRLGEEDLSLWIYYGNRPFPSQPSEPGFRRLNILKIYPTHLGLQIGRDVLDLRPGTWPEAVRPRRAEFGRDGA